MIFCLICRKTLIRYRASISLIKHSITLQVPLLLLKTRIKKKTAVKLKEEISEIDGVSNVMWVDDIADISIPEDMLPDDLKNVFYSKDGNATLMMVQFTQGGASESTMDAIKSIRKCMNKKYVYERCFHNNV